MATKNDPAILFVKPGAISSEDRATLVEAGVIVIQIDDPEAVKFTRATVEISGNELLREAMRIINTVSGDATRTAFCRAFESVLKGSKSPSGV